MAHAAEQTPTYTLNWAVGPDRTGKLVLTNSSLTVILSKGVCSTLPCHDSHTLVQCSAQMIDTETSGKEQFDLRLTSCSFDGAIVIQGSFDPSFLDLFIEEKTEVLFPLPLKKHVYNMTMFGDVITLTIPSLPVVETRVVTKKIPMEEIEYTLPSGISFDNWEKRFRLPKTSKTPKFREEEINSKYFCSLPCECLTSIQCHDGYVPVKCSTKLAWLQNGAKTSVVLLLSSKLLETPIYVQIDTPHSSFLDLFSVGKTNRVFFPLPIPKRMFSVEVNDILNFKFKCLKGESGPEKKSERAEKNERMTRGAIGYDCDDPLPDTYEVQRPNQVWSTVSNCWELIRKPKPRDRDWKWDDSNASWLCEIDPETNFLKKFDRTRYTNCWPKH